ncbi:hypothetical protein [Kitasatospora sp. LaBMicrA B282]|uniref:hypothetical protein n=1 Tax=Kitasatospora sp. LaBMicrA B282 TaxID=3420949 RepID=UPI003D0B933C
MTGTVHSAWHTRPAVAAAPGTPAALAAGAPAVPEPAAVRARTTQPLGDPGLIDAVAAAGDGAPVGSAEPGPARAAHRADRQHPLPPTDYDDDL